MKVRFRQNKLHLYKKLAIKSLGKKKSCLANTLWMLHFNITEDSVNAQDVKVSLHTHNFCYISNYRGIITNYKCVYQLIVPYHFL